MVRVKKKSLVDVTADFIKGEIAGGLYFPGNRIDTVRKLSVRLGVSHLTAVGALRKLAEGGWIVIKPGSGSFVAANLPERIASKPRPTQGLPDRSVYFFFVRDPSQGSYHSEVLCFLQREIERYGWSLKVGHTTDIELLERVKSEQSVVGVVHASPKPESQRIDFPKPVVNYGMSPSNPWNCCICPDNYQGGFNAGSVLFEKQRRDIVFVTITDRFVLSGNYPELHFAERYQGLIDSLRWRGEHQPAQIAWDAPSGHCGEVREILQNVKNGSRRGVTLVVANRVMAAEIYRLAMEMELKIPDDLGMVTFISRGGSDSNYNINTFDFSRREMGKQICRMLFMAHNNEPLPSRVILPISFMTEEGSL
ncbi:MAG: GntR family transcriptional regulator [Victivallales bacterium]|nr:GntR family transcriptional regulator [Victivallales bacterium]